MDWDLCKTFVAVAENGSLAAAARQLRSSHPTVGRKIASLERQLGTRLFARSDQGLVADRAGTKIPRACRCDGGSGAARRGRGLRDRAAGARRGQAVDRRDARRALADAADERVPARARSSRARDHHPSVSGERAPPRGRRGVAARRCRRREPRRPPHRPARHRLLRLARLCGPPQASRTARRVEGPQRDRLCRPRLQRRSRALERRHHPPRHGGDALLLAGRHARGRAGRARHLGAVMLRRRRAS